MALHDNVESVTVVWCDEDEDADALGGVGLDVVARGGGGKILAR
jgi:hypothetical protein